MVFVHSSTFPRFSLCPVVCVGLKYMIPRVHLAIHTYTKLDNGKQSCPTTYVVLGGGWADSKNDT